MVEAPEMIIPLSAGTESHTSSLLELQGIKRHISDKGFHDLTIDFEMIKLFYHIFPLKHKYALCAGRHTHSDTHT